MYSYFYRRSKYSHTRGSELTNAGHERGQSMAKPEATESRESYELWRGPDRHRCEASGVWALAVARPSPKPKTARSFVSGHSHTTGSTNERVSTRGKWRPGANSRASMKSQPPAIGIGYKKRVYSPNRIAFPVKRVDGTPTESVIPRTRQEQVRTHLLGRGDRSDHQRTPKGSGSLWTVCGSGSMRWPRRVETDSQAPWLPRRTAQDNG